MTFNFKSYTSWGSALPIIVIIVNVNTPQFVCRGTEGEACPTAGTQQPVKRENSWEKQCANQVK